MNISDYSSLSNQQLFNSADECKQRNDFAGASTYYQILEARGSVEAVYQLALCHLNPDWMSRSEDRAYALLQAASEKKHLLAMNRLGCLLITGEDVDKLEEGANYLCEAADLGLTKAQFNYAECLRQGIGVEKNEEYAISWYQAAADEGHPKSAYWVGRRFHQDGDLEEATHYYNIAKRINHIPALDGLFEIRQTRIERALASQFTI